MIIEVSTNQLSDYDILSEVYMDEETKKWIKDNWKTSNELHTKNEFKTSTITDDEYLKLKEIINVLKTEKEDYKVYKSAFDKLCKFCNISNKGTIITKYNLSKSKEDDKNELYIEYTGNIRPINLPKNLKLYHQSPVEGIKNLIPRWKLRGKNESGYLCATPRVYFTLNKSLPRYLTDNIGTGKLHLYEAINTPTSVYVDPLLHATFQKAVYVETETPIPVREINPETLSDQIKDTVKSVSPFRKKDD